MLWWFLPYISMNQPGVHMCPHREPPSHLPPCPILVHSAPALSAPLLASNLDWSSILHMVVYMFQCYSLNSSHPCFLPQSPKVCSLHLCLFYHLAYRVIIAIFLNSIYLFINILYWCFSFWLTSLSMIGFSFIHPIRTDSDVLFFIAE